MNAGSRIKNRMQKLHGTLRRKNARGPFYYRLTVANGVRKEFALKTTDELEALQRAEELDSIWTAPTMDVAAAQLNAIKGFSRQAENSRSQKAGPNTRFTRSGQLRIP